MRALAELAHHAGRPQDAADKLAAALSASAAAAAPCYFQATRNELARAQRGDAARLARAFELSKRGRARALLDVVVANLRRPASGEEPAVLGAWRQLTMQARVWTGMIAQLRGSTNADAAAQRMALEAQLAAAEADLQRATADLAVALPQFADAVRSEPQVAALDEIIALLPPRTAMLQYMTLGNELLSWAITRDGMQPGPIMRAFYDALHGGAPPSAALRDAQAAVRAAAPGQLDRDAEPEQPAAAADGRHPRYWAPFVVVGVWSREGT